MGSKQVNVVQRTLNEYVDSLNALNCLRRRYIYAFTPNARTRTIEHRLFTCLCHAHFQLGGSHFLALTFMFITPWISLMMCIVANL